MRSIIDRWLRFRAWVAERRDEIGSLVVQIEDIKERHRREIDRKDDTIKMQSGQIEFLTAMLENRTSWIERDTARQERDRAVSEALLPRPSQQ